MYKIVLVVAVFAFAIQGSLGSPLAETEKSAGTEAKQPEVQSKPSENKPTDEPPSQSTSTTTSPSTTAAPKSGASSTEICLLLVQVSSLALVAKHVLM